MEKSFIGSCLVLGCLLAGCQFPNAITNGTTDANAQDMNPLRYEILGEAEFASAVSLGYGGPAESDAVGGEGVRGLLKRPIIIRYHALPALPAGAEIPLTAAVDLAEEPDTLIAVNLDAQETERRPFAYNPDEGKLRFTFLAGERLCVMPVARAVADTGEGGLVSPDNGTDVLLKAITPGSLKPFSVTTNTGTTIRVVVNPSYFRDRYWWDYTLSYDVYDRNDDEPTWIFPGQQMKKIDSGSTTGVISVAVPSSGVYMFRIKARYRYKKWYWFFGRHEYFTNFQEESVWVQDVAVEQYALSESQRRELADTYAPILVMDKEEYYTPASLEYIFNKSETNAALNEERYGLKDAFKKDNFAFGDIDSVLPFFGHRNGLIDVSSHDKAARSAMAHRTNPNDPVIYYSFQERADYNYIHYHFLYAYDLKTGSLVSPAVGSPSSPPLGSHIFDRESFVVVLDKSNQPVYSVYGGHLSSSAFSYLNYNALFKPIKLSWSGGRIRRVWASSPTIAKKGDPDVLMDDDTIRAGTHPLVFVAWGSHAVYPYPGEYLSGVYERVGMPASSSYAANQILMPPSVPFARLRRYELRDLGTGMITSFSPHKYLAFSGYMVDVLGLTNAKFPPYTNREMAPNTYVFRADTVVWNWIPSDMKGILDNLEGVIDDYIVVTDPFSPY